MTAEVATCKTNFQCQLLMGVACYSNLTKMPIPSCAYLLESHGRVLLTEPISVCEAGLSLLPFPATAETDPRNAAYGGTTGGGHRSATGRRNGRKSGLHPFMEIFCKDSTHYLLCMIFQHGSLSRNNNVGSFLLFGERYGMF